MPAGASLWNAGAPWIQDCFFLASWVAQHDPPRLALYSLTESARTPFHAEPTHLALGTYYIFVTVSLPGDTNADNDVSDSIAITVVGQRPPFDLSVQIESISPASVAAGGEVVVVYRVTGANLLSGTFDRTLYVSPDSIITTGDLRINTRRFDLVNGTARVTSGENSIPSDLSPGPYFLGIIVQTVGDTDPSNNSASRAITVTAR